MKLLRFAENELVYESINDHIQSTNEYFESERCSMWYSKKEMNTFKTDVNIFQRNRRRASNNDNLNSDSGENAQYFSSMYFLSDEKSRLRKRRKYCVIKIILESQGRLKDSELASVSNGLTYYARKDALEHAENHAKVAY